MNKMPLLDYQLNAETRRRDGVLISDLEGLEIPLDTFIVVRGYVHGATGSEYHFNLGFDNKFPGVKVTPEDTITPEYFTVIPRLARRIGTTINPQTGEGNFARPRDKRALVAILEGIFEEFSVEDKDKSVIIDYRKG